MKSLVASFNAQSYRRHYIFKKRQPIMSIKPGPKRIAYSTGTYDQRQRDNKNLFQKGLNELVNSSYHFA